MAQDSKTSLRSPEAGRPGVRRAYRVREVSEMTGIPASTLRRMVRAGELNPIVGFRTWLIAAEDLDAILNKRLRNQFAATGRANNS